MMFSLSGFFEALGKISYETGWMVEAVAGTRCEYPSYVKHKNV